MSITDPRTEITHDLHIGQVYKDSRTDEEMVLVYLDTESYLLRDKSGNHRLGTRKEFEKNVGSDRFKLRPDHGGFGNTGRLSRVQARAEEYRERDGRKAGHYADALTEAVSILTDDTSSDDREIIPFEELDGIGDKAAQNLRAAGFKTKTDIRHANDSELLDVSWVGEKGVTAMREHVEYEGDE